MATFKTLGGKDFTSRDLISFAKYSYAADPRKWQDKKTAFSGPADTVRNTFGHREDYASTSEIDPTFDYNKFDWGDISATLESWKTGGDATLAGVANSFTPIMATAKADTGIYKLGELQNQAQAITAGGELDAQMAQWSSILEGKGSTETVKALDSNKALALSTLTQTAAAMKKQIETNTASGRLQVEADYAGVTDEILAGVAKLQAMTTDDWAARGMAFAGPLQRMQADIGAAGATEIGKAMAQKGARLGKLANDLISYTAQIDIDVLTKNADIVMQHGLQMAALLDKDAAVRQEATAMLAGLGVKKETLKTLVPLQTQISQLQTEGAYDTAKAAEATAAEEKQYTRRTNSAQLEAQYGIVMDESGKVLSTHPTFAQEQAMMNDAAQLMGAYGISVKMVNGKPVITDSLTTAENISLRNVAVSEGELALAQDKWEKELELAGIKALPPEPTAAEIAAHRDQLLQEMNDPMTPASIKSSLMLEYQSLNPFLSGQSFTNFLFGVPSKNGSVAVPGLLNGVDRSEIYHYIDNMQNGERQLETAILAAITINPELPFSKAWENAISSFDTPPTSAEMTGALTALGYMAGVPFKTYSGGVAGKPGAETGYASFFAEMDARGQDVLGAYKTTKPIAPFVPQTAQADSAISEAAKKQKYDQLIGMGWNPEDAKAMTGYGG